MAPSTAQLPVTASDRLLTEHEAASMLGWSRKTLQQRRWRGVPPIYVKIGSSVRYLERDILAFIERGRFDREIQDQFEPDRAKQAAPSASRAR